MRAKLQDEIVFRDNRLNLESDWAGNEAPPFR